MLSKLDFISSLPAVFHQKLFVHPLYMWATLLVLCVLSLAISKIVRIILESYVTTKFLKLLKLQIKEEQQKTFSRPLGYFSFALLLYLLHNLIGFNEQTNDVIERICYIALGISGTWVSIAVAGIFELYFASKARKTRTKFDDILVPLISKSAKVFIFCIGLLFIAHSLTIDVKNIIAGLGIGGLAFALAAKDTLSNLFGSLMIVLDRPFDVGDWITLSSGVEGTVEQVGFRSTRVRTFYDSLISIPNSNLTNTHIENYAKRKYRRMRIFLGVQYDTPASKIEAFCEGIRKIILSHKYTRKDYFNVYFNNFSASSLDILVHMFWEVPDAATENAERHRFLLDVLRLGNSMGIDFAFPTQTIHLYSEEKKVNEELRAQEPREFYDFGKNTAQEILQKPYTAAEPRSSQIIEDTDEIKFK